MLAWAYGEEPVELWEMHLGLMSDKLRKGLEDPKEILIAWNSSFERGMMEYKLGIVTPVERWLDPQASARYLSLPGDLDTVSEILDLPSEMAKDKDGKRLIDIFSKLTVPRKKKGQERTEPYFRDWITDSEDWKKFGEYCRRDVIAEREIQRRLTLLGTFPLPPKEQKIWYFDQKVNDRGIPLDRQFVINMYELGTKAKKEAIEEQNKITGLDNSNSRNQMLKWVKAQGFIGNSLRKEAVEAELKYNESLTPLGKQVLVARKAASSTTYKKTAAILRLASSDDRLRNQFVYMGSSRCGRWAGSGFQFHNMARPLEEFEDEAVMTEARSLIHNNDYEGIIDRFSSLTALKDYTDSAKRFGAVLLTIKSCIRTAFVPSKGKRFNVCDLNAIETRVGAWVAECPSLLDVFHKNRDPYLDFAVKMTQIPYERLASDIKSKDPSIKAAAKRHRQVAKPGVLGCVYRLGGGQMGKTKDGDPIKQGLAGYAENMGVDMSFETAREVVRVFRESYKEIPQFWYNVEKAIAEVLGGIQTKRELGPNGCIKIDKINLKDRHPILRIQLPSGRFLHYVDARIESCVMPWKDPDGNEAYKNTLVYAGIDQKTKQWSLVKSHGGKTFENIVQGIARDVLAEYMLTIEEIYNMLICLHVHDEGGSETDNDPFSPGLREMEHVMSQPISWAQGLPLGADGFEGLHYRK
jgi:DNA polymerase